MSDSGKIEALFHISASSSDKEKAQAIVSSIQIKTEGDPKKVSMAVDFPSEHTIFYYPGVVSPKKSLLQKTRSHVRYHGREMTIFSEPSPAALSISVDVHLKVPRGGTLKVDNLVGALTARGPECDMNVETMTADVAIENVKGKVNVATSSGNIVIQTLTGPLQCMSGTGKIALTDIQGDVAANCATGTISLSSSEFANATLETGTGSITVTKSKGDLNALTGSGKVHIDEHRDARLLRIRTGTGSIRLKGDFSILETFCIQTGTGNVTFASTPFPEALFEISVGIGQIAIDVPGLKTKGHPVRKFHGSIHETPKGSGTIRAGSGNIKISTSQKKESAPAHANAQKHN